MNTRYCALCFFQLPDDATQVSTISLAGRPMMRVHKSPCGTQAMQYAGAAVQAAQTTVIGAVSKRFPVAGAVLKLIADLRKARSDGAENRRTA